MTTAAAWVNVAKAQSKGNFVAVHLELMVDDSQMEQLKKLLFGSRENTQHPIWLSDTNPVPAEPAPPPTDTSATPSASPGIW
jgi:hypothetical protein